MNEDHYAIYKVDETIAQSVVKDTFTFAFMLLCIYVSQGSAWWTFFTGSLLIAVLGTRVMVSLKKSRVAFRTKKDLQEWVDSLPD